MFGIDPCIVIFVGWEVHSIQGAPQPSKESIGISVFVLLARPCSSGSTTDCLSGNTLSRSCSGTRTVACSVECFRFAGKTGTAIAVSLADLSRSPAHGLLLLLLLATAAAAASATTASGALDRLEVAANGSSVRSHGGTQIVGQNTLGHGVVQTFAVHVSGDSSVGSLLGVDGWNVIKLESAVGTQVTGRVGVLDVVGSGWNGGTVAGAVFLGPQLCECAPTGFTGSTSLGSHIGNRFLQVPARPCISIHDE